MNRPSVRTVIQSGAGFRKARRLLPLTSETVAPSPVIHRGSRECEWYRRGHVAVGAALERRGPVDDFDGVGRQAQRRRPIARLAVGVEDQEPDPLEREDRKRRRRRQRERDGLTQRDGRRGNG